MKIFLALVGVLILVSGVGLGMNLDIGPRMAVAEEKLSSIPEIHAEASSAFGQAAMNGQRLDTFAASVKDIADAVKEMSDNVKAVEIAIAKHEPR